MDIVDQVTPELVEAMARLVPQLSRSAPPLTGEELAEIVQGASTVMFVARVEGHVVGSLTLVVFRIPTGVRAWIEDVVVDEAARGAGVGAALNRAAMAEAERRGVRTVDLTSRPSREVANRLYQRLGFVVRDTSVYRWVPRPDRRLSGSGAKKVLGGLADLPVTVGRARVRSVASTSGPSNGRQR